MIIDTTKKRPNYREIIKHILEEEEMVQLIDSYSYEHKKSLITYLMQRGLMNADLRYIRSF